MCCICECCLCCFKNISPLAISITALILNIIAFIFLIWEAADHFFMKKYIRTLFWFGFSLETIGLTCVIGILILVLVRNKNNSSVINTIGKGICIALMIMLPIAVLFVIISSICCLAEYIKYVVKEIEETYDDLVYDYYNNYYYYDKKTRRYNRSIPARYWVSIIIPPFMYLILISIATKCIRALFTIFSEDIYDSIAEKRERDKHNNQEIEKQQTEQTNAVINNQTVPASNLTNPPAFNQNSTITTPYNNLNNPNYANNNMNPAFPKN